MPDKDKKTINIIFLPDINGKIGRQAVKKLLPKLKKEAEADFVIANADNLAHGSGISAETVEEMLAAGVNCLTNGDHAFNRFKAAEKLFDSELPLIRPANFPLACPGRGCLLFNIGKKYPFKLAVVNLCGRVFMKQDFDCPFVRAEEILANLEKDKVSAIIIDIHAEATSEKIALRKFLGSRISALIGTHTHVQTADPEVAPGGTAYITDAGMIGAADGIIGVDPENILKTFLTQVKFPHHIPENGRALFNAVVITLDRLTGKAREIRTIKEIVKIS